MTPDAWGLFLVCAFIAEVLGTMAGFGAATVLTPVAILFLEPKTAVTIVACFHLFGNAARLRFFGRHIDWSVWWRFGLVGVVCSVAGALVTTRLPSAAITLLVGLFLLGYAALDTVGAGQHRWPRGTWLLVGGGAVSGSIAGLIGTGGAIRSACLLAFGLARDAYLGTSAAIALIVDATRLPVYVSAQYLPESLWPVVATLVLVAFGGAWLGQRLVRCLPATAFRRFVLGLLTLMGLKLAWDGWRHLV